MNHFFGTKKHNNIFIDGIDQAKLDKIICKT